MKKKETKCMSIKESEVKVVSIACDYNISFQKIIKEGKHDASKLCLYDSHNCEMVARESMFDIKNVSGNSKDYRNVLSIDVALLSIGKDEALILYNDYFFPREKKWWMDKFSPSAYYRLKKRAITKFLCVVSEW